MNANNQPEMTDGDGVKNLREEVVAVGVMDQEIEGMIVWTIVVLLVTARIAGLCVGMTVIAWMIAAWMIVVLLVTAWMIVVHPCVGMIEMNADQGVVMLGNQVQAEVREIFSILTELIYLLDNFSKLDQTCEVDQIV